MNKVFFIGRLSKDVTLFETPSGVAVASFSIAVKRPYVNANGERETDFFNCVAFRTLAQNCNKYLSKGKKAIVIGYLQNRSYEDKEGVKRVVTEIIASDVEFIDFSEKPPQTENESVKTTTKNDIEQQTLMLEPINEDDLPF